MSATTRPADSPDLPPALSLFVQANPAQYGKPLSVVFEVRNGGAEEIEIEHKIMCGRTYLRQSAETNKQFGSGNDLRWDDGDKYIVWFHLSTPVPTGGFLQIPDLRIFGGPSQRTLIEPGKSLLYRVDLPAALGLQDACEIHFSLVQKNHEVARSDTATINVSR
jgi:hypothetical protein